MTRPTGVGRGGRRPGAGRPRKPRAGPVALPAPRPTSEPRSAMEMARLYADSAIEVLAKIAAEGSSDRIRVQAARILLNRAYGLPRTCPSAGSGSVAGEDA